jgi:gamma-glutamyltranspeptidase/glutathione hydrolase
LNEDEVDRLNYYREDFLKYNKHDIPFVKEGEWEPGDILKQKELANTLREILLNEEAGFYGSWVAERIDSQMRADGGRITLDDLQAYQHFGENRYLQVTGNTVCFHATAIKWWKCPAQLVKMVEAFDLKKMGFQNTESIHLMVESERRVYADRASHLGDADYYEVPDFMLLDSLYLLKRMQNFSGIGQRPVIPSEREAPFW